MEEHSVVKREIKQFFEERCKEMNQPLKLCFEGIVLKKLEESQALKRKLK